MWKVAFYWTAHSLKFSRPGHVFSLNQPLFVSPKHASVITRDGYAVDSPGQACR